MTITYGPESQKLYNAHINRCQKLSYIYIYIYIYIPIRKCIALSEMQNKNETV